MHNFQSLTQREKLFLGLILVLAIGLGVFLLTGKAPQKGPIISACAALLQEWQAAHPADAAPKETYAGEIAEVDFNGVEYPQLNRLKNGISKAAKGGANFAGHYAVVEWGCGSSCQEHAVVDVQSGKIIVFGILSEAGLQFHPESNTIITNPETNFPTMADLGTMTLDDKIYWYNLPREYYVLEEKDGAASVRRICIENAFEGQGL
ncbi:MAG: hypothetical protein AAB605_03470 [Patescibacteria group bacterium]